MLETCEISMDAQIRDIEICQFMKFCLKYEMSHCKHNHQPRCQSQELGLHLDFVNFSCLENFNVILVLSCNLKVNVIFCPQEIFVTT